MTEILSQDEINALLISITTGDVDTSDYQSIKEQTKVRIYDFRRPDKFTSDYIRTLQMIHETFARLTSTMISAQLRTMASFHVASVDQLTFEEFIRSISNPTTLAVVEMNPLAGSAIIEICPQISFAIIDKLFGGYGNASGIDRELTDIELSALESVFIGMISNLKYSWGNIINLKAGLQNIETNPQFAQIVPPDDMIALITLESGIGEVVGFINLCLPYITLEPVIKKLAAQYRFTSSDSGNGKSISGDISGASYKRYISYSGAVENMTPDDMRKLKRGTRIPLKNEVSAETSFEYAGLKKEGHNE